MPGTASRSRAALETDRQGRAVGAQRDVIVDSIARLTPRERQIMDLLALGHSSKRSRQARRSSGVSPDPGPFAWPRTLSRWTELDNAQVRVLRVKLGAHEKIPMHDVGAGVAVLLTDSHVKFTYADGKTEERSGKAGEIRWNAGGGKRALENLRDQPSEVVVVQLKTKPAARKRK